VGDTIALLRCTRPIVSLAKIAERSLSLGIEVGERAKVRPPTFTKPTSRCHERLRGREGRDQRTVDAGVAPVVVKDLRRLEALDDDVDAER
jgi:hypothetical protein